MTEPTQNMEQDSQDLTDQELPPISEDWIDDLDKPDSTTQGLDIPQKNTPFNPTIERRKAGLEPAPFNPTLERRMAGLSPLPTNQDPSSTVVTPPMEQENVSSSTQTDISQNQSTAQENVSQNESSAQEIPHAEPYKAFDTNNFSVRFIELESTTIPSFMKFLQK